ncbi:sensor histidine kinase [Streptomyces sannanensis]
MRFRGKSIRRKIVALLLVPLVSLTGMWGFATVLTGREAADLLDVAHVIDKVGYPMEDTIRVIQEERRQTLIYLADPGASDALAALRGKRDATDGVVAKIRANAADAAVRDELTPGSSERLTSILEALEGIGDLRERVEQSTVTRAQALDLFNHLVDPCYGFLMSLHTLEEVELDRQGRALVGITRAREMLSREDALVASALVDSTVEAGELREISSLIANRELLYDVNLAILPDVEGIIFENFWGGPDTEPLRATEEKLVAQGPTERVRGISASSWEDIAPPVLDWLTEEGTAAGDRYKERVEPAAMNVLIKAGLAGVLGFLALLASIVVSARVARDLIHDLSGLRKEAHEASGVRLPSVMRRLAAGEQVDVETEAPRLEYEKDEIGQVGLALNTLQRAAVEAAVKQAEMRRGISEVFVNLARRNQVLLHRQLTLLDTMERRTEDTEELADLFRLDHLTTRMRRHAEGLVILSGASPSRQWRKPIQLMDVVRAAVAEVEDYERIEVRRLPRIGVSGPAVADLTHLIAELLENATVFSPPHTAVQVLGERVANGFTLEIHDRGLGMTPEALLDANLRLAETPEFELSDTDRLGLFVVSRLAQRQNVRVSLQTSPYGGTTAVVFIPAALLTDAPDTNGVGFRLDRKAADQPVDRTAPDGRRGTLSPLPVGAPAPSLLDGPVELEPPVGALDFDETDRLGVLTPLDTPESARGGLLSAARRDSAADREEHTQADDETDEPGASVRSISGPVPLPRRRRTPTLVSDRGRRVDTKARTHSMPPAEPVREPVRESRADDGPALGGLPRRVRQASLAPQLKADAAARRDGHQSTDAPHHTDCDAEEVRARMTSLQRGWQRGRRQNAEQAAAGDPAHGNTPEGDGR